MKIAVTSLNQWISMVLVCGLFPHIATAQSEWDRVQIIQPGRSVQVKLHSTKTIKGQMDAWRADGLSVRQGKSVTSIDRSQVAEVALLIGRSRGRKALLAGAITAGAVGGVLGAAYAGASDDCCIGAPAAAVVPLVAG